MLLMFGKFQHHYYCEPGFSQYCLKQYLVYFTNFFSRKSGSQYVAGAYVASVASSLVHNNYVAGAYVASV